MRDESKAITTTETVFSNKFWRNRKGEAVCVEIKKLNGEAHVIDIRQWFTAGDGSLRPTSRGVCMALRKLPEIKGAVDKALNAARDLGLIGPEVTR